MLRALLAVLPPAAAEKVLVSGYVLLFALAARFFAGAVDPTRRWLAFLAFPFALNATLHNGFYSFAISVALTVRALLDPLAGTFVLSAVMVAVILHTARLRNTAK